MAYELASAGAEVCLLERGKRYPPGSFPRSPFRTGRNFWDPSEGYYGLFDVWSFRHSEAVVAAGLGGGSLIYANVLLRKPEEWFVETFPDGGYKKWPLTRADIDPHYDAVEAVLGAEPFPLAVPPYDKCRKAQAFKSAAERLKRTSRSPEWLPVNLGITFASRPGGPPAPGDPIEESVPNLHGSTRLTCRLCGECDVGCNYGSKNTLDYNYLTLAALAKPHPCQIRDLCEVRSFRPRDGGGYEVDYVTHEPEIWEGKPRGSDGQRVTTLVTDRLILSAGTLGSTYLLLKNRRNFPKLSRALGSRYSTNGDLLTFVLRCTDPATNPPAARIIDPSGGPVITGAIRVDRGPHGGFYLEDAGYPEFVNWLAEVSDAGGWIRRSAGYVWRRLVDWITREPRSEIDAQLAELIGPCALSAGSMPLLGMGRDTPDGVMGLRRSNRDGKEYLDVDWQQRASRSHFDALTTFSRQVAEALGGDLMENPLTRFLHRLITVHPLGGCPMGSVLEEGVVDSNGQVFNYPGLYVADGAVMPGPVGANPSLTIAALSRRFSHDMIQNRPNGGRSWR